MIIFLCFKYNKDDTLAETDSNKKVDFSIVSIELIHQYQVSETTIEIDIQKHSVALAPLAVSTISHSDSTKYKPLLQMANTTHTHGKSIFHLTIQHCTSQ